MPSDLEDTIETFLSQPEDILLFRGEDATNQGGLHFATNKFWARQFGNVLLTGTLPPGSNVHLITIDDLEGAVYKGVEPTTAWWVSFFDRTGYDAVVGTDPMRQSMLDVIVNPKHIHHFMPSN